MFVVVSHSGLLVTAIIGNNITNHNTTQYDSFQFFVFLTKKENSTVIIIC